MPISAHLKESSTGVRWLKDNTGRMVGFVDDKGNQFLVPAAADADGIGAAQELLTPIGADFQGVVRRVDTGAAVETGVSASQRALYGPLDPLSLRKWRAAVSKARRGSTSARLLVVGDSTARGAGSQVSNQQAASWPTQFAALAAGFGLSGNWQNFICCPNVGNAAAYNAFDNRVAFSGSAEVVDLAANAVSLGGSIFRLTATGTIVFTTTTAVDGFEIYWIQSTTNNAGGTFSWAVDGGGATNVSTTGSNAIGKTTITGLSAGTHVLTLAWVSGNVAIIGAVGTVTNGAVTVINTGNVGTATVNVNFSTYPWSPIPAIASYLPDLTVIDLGINDELNGASIASYTTNMQAIITAAKAAGDVVLKTHNPCAASTASQQAVIDAIYALAVTNTVPVIDTWQRWGSNLVYSALNTLGYYSDTNHPAAIGYGDVAEHNAQMLLRV